MKENKLTSTKNELTPQENPIEEIENLILNIRGKQVMLDRDIARLYGVETKVLNQAVKRNIERFPEDFMFQLTKEECSRSQLVTLNTQTADYESSTRLRSQIVTLDDNESTKKGRGKYSKYLSYAFTENGIAMLSSVLKSEKAINVNIHIMRAFVALRRNILSNSEGIISRFEKLEFSQLELYKYIASTDKKVDSVIETLSKHNLPIEGIFFDGQVFDAHILMSELIRSATNRLILIDNYVDETVLTLLVKRNQDVKAKIYTQKISADFQLDINRHNSQYPPIEVSIYRQSHDRFLIVDDKIYHIGASVKDLGRKLCAVMLMESTNVDEVLNKLGEVQ